MIRPGDDWGAPLEATDTVIDAGYADRWLSLMAGQHPGAVLRFRPIDTSDFGRALGLPLGASPVDHVDRGLVLPCDLMAIDDRGVAINALILGTPPDWLRWWHRDHPVEVEVDGRPVGSGRATTVVVANGQFFHGKNLVPRGHPGDGRLEVQVYALRRGERLAMRRRLGRGDHVPHPRIAQATGRHVVVRWGGGPRPADVDGSGGGTRTEEIEVDVRPGAARVLI